MNLFLIRFLIPVSFLILSLHAFADDEKEIYTDKIYKANIRTVQLYVDPLMLSDPVIPLRGVSQLHLAFDDLDGEKKNYSYAVIQCNYDWSKSELNSFDYTDGFAEQEIRDYEFSFNTNQTYTHYSLLFPNENFRITKSGNYIIQVYLDNDPEQIVLTRRFVVFESIVQINSNVHQAENVAYSRTHQQVNFTILHHGVVFSNPLSEINVLLLQNFRWDNAITNVSPQFVKPEALDYHYSMKTSFPAGKEFRYLDIRTTRYKTDRVSVMEEKGNTYLLTLFGDDIRNNQPYLYRNDINGKFIPGTLDYIDQDAQSEYVWVKFVLPVDYPLRGGKIYLLGKFTDWQLQPEYEMHFNSATSAYENTLYLKEGYYEYLYRFVSDQHSDQSEDEDNNDDLIEGSDYETENTYQILVYYRPFSSRYDEVIGYKATDSFNR